MSGRQGFITNHETYVYQESPTTGSAAFGLDSADTDKWKLIVLATDGAKPTGTGQMTIDPAANGNITFVPNGAGNVTISNGGLTITAGGLTVTAGNTTLTPLGTAGYVTNTAAGILGTAATTQYALQVGGATGAFSSLAVGTAGQIITSGGAGANPAWTTTTYPATTAIGDVLVASAANTIGVVSGATTAGWVLTANGAGSAPTFQANPADGIVTLNGDSGSATGATVTIAGGTNITTAGAAATLTVNLDAVLAGLTSTTFATGGSVQTGTTATNTLLIQAYDVDGTAYVPFITLTAADTPTCDLDTAVTIGTKYIYRADGTDVPVADGGTGASTLTDHGVLLGSGTSAITATAVGATGEVFVGATGADATWLAAGDANKVLTAHGAGSAVTWETPSSGGITWSVITADQNAAADNGYICNKAGVLTLTLPASCAAGKTIRVTGINTSNGWKLAQNAGQTIYWDESTATTTGAGGYLQSSDKYDAVEIVCSVTDTSFVVVSSKGNITIA